MCKQATPCSGNTPKIILVILRKQNKKLVQVKQEKNAAVTPLNSVQEEKDVMEADLEGSRNDLEDANACMEQTYPGQDIWIRRFDKLASMVARQDDGAILSEILN